MPAYPRKLTETLAIRCAGAFKFMPKGYGLRLALLSDIDAIMDVMNQCFKTDLPERRDFRYYLNQVHGALFVMTDAKGNVVGYHHLEANARTKILYLNTIAIAKKHRGKGLGKALYKFQEMLAKQGHFNRIRFHVSNRNDASAKLAKASGYQVIRLEKGYLHDGSDSYLMEKKIV